MRCAVAPVRAGFEPATPRKGRGGALAAMSKNGRCLMPAKLAKRVAGRSGRGAGSTLGPAAASSQPRSWPGGPGGRKPVASPGPTRHTVKKTGVPCRVKTWSRLAAIPVACPGVGSCERVKSRTAGQVRVEGPGRARQAVGHRAPSRPGEGGLGRQVGELPQRDARARGASGTPCLSRSHVVRGGGPLPGWRARGPARGRRGHGAGRSAQPSQVFHPSTEH